MSEQAKNILIIDDDQTFRELLSETLAVRGFTTFCAEDTEAADKLLSEHKINIILLDLMMPKEDGISFCRRLRKSCQIPVIFISAVNDEVEEVLALEVGGLYYVQKPFSSRLLLTKIDKALTIYDQYTVNQQQNTLLEYKDYDFGSWLFLSNHRKIVNKKTKHSIKLGNREKDFLMLLIHDDGPVSKEKALQLIYQKEYSFEDNSINSLIYRLRKKITECIQSDEEFIVSAYSDGYVLTVKPVGIA
ncbi:MULTISPECIES: response regulator transcription factor [Cysteiniphilum]|uniref:response regulator transcription factor n=1 Tax=Cysteiniphilum TaxID=2056696 RepID=UPI00178735A8|nr:MULTISPECIES: response regulator transcription factor [Cysteiniphilum]